MDTNISKFIDVLCDNSLHIKHYNAPSNMDDSFDYSTWVFDENELVKEFDIPGDGGTLWYLQKDFIESRNYNNTRVLLNGYWKTKDFDEFLHSEFAEFKAYFTKNNYWNDQSLKDELSKRIRSSNIYLRHIMHVNNRNGVRLIDSLFKVKYEYANETIRFIDNPLIIISNQAEQKQTKPKKPIDNLTCLTQNQVVILFHYLRKQELVGRGMPDKMYAQYISELTGFANEPIRKDLSNIKNIDSIEFIEANYSAVQRVLAEVTKKIKSESVERFS